MRPVGGKHARSWSGWQCIRPAEMMGVMLGSFMLGSPFQPWRNLPMRVGWAAAAPGIAVPWLWPTRYGHVLHNRLFLKLQRRSV